MEAYNLRKNSALKELILIYNRKLTTACKQKGIIILPQSTGIIVEGTDKSNARIMSATLQSQYPPPTYTLYCPYNTIDEWNFSPAFYANKQVGRGDNFGISLDTIISQVQIAYPDYTIKDIYVKFTLASSPSSYLFAVNVGYLLSNTPSTPTLYEFTFPSNVGATYMQTAGYTGRGTFTLIIESLKINFN